MITSADIVYISGPMSGLPEYNKPAFFLAEKIISTLIGAQVLNPAHQPSGHSWGEYMRRDIDLLSRATAVLALPGWQQSRGARIEINWAIQAGLTIVEV